MVMRGMEMEKEMGLKIMACTSLHELFYLHATHGYFLETTEKRIAPCSR
jgi:peroxiredoxin family protein